MRPNWQNGIVSGALAKADDIQTLRDEINRVRSVVGLPQITWPTVTTMSASDLVQMRTAIQDIWSDSDLNFGDLPNWTGGAPTPNDLNLAVHMMDLRTWISRASDFPPEQGVDTYSYNPVNPPQTDWAVIGSGWRSNIQGLSSTAPDANKVKYVRCKVVAKPDANGMRVLLSGDQESRGKFVEAFNIYKDQLRVFATLTLETYLRDKPYNAGLGTVGTVSNTNEYIEGFANEFSILHNSYFGPAGVTDYIIWNEPNDTNPDVQPKYLSEAQFAALLRRCWQVVLQPLPAQSRPRIYWGGILFTGVNSQLDPEPGQVDYVQNVYTAVKGQLAADPSNMRPVDDKLPWNGINIHLHHTPREDTISGGLVSFVKNLMHDHIWPIQIDNGDDGWILVGEWGVTRKEVSDEAASLQKAFQRIRPWCTAMFYFTHPDFPERDLSPPPTPPPHDPAYWWGLVNRIPQDGTWITDTDTDLGPK